MPKQRIYKLKQTAKNPVVWIGLVGALVYSSWPLGFILNPAVSHHAFASQLEASNQPYNWLFILLDILCGIALLVGGVMQWNKKPRLAIKLSILGYMSFAALVIVAAIAPYNCNSLSVGSCQASIIHSPLFIIHGLASIISVLFLLGSMVLLIKLLFEKHAYHWLNIVGLFIVACWGLLGVCALVFGKHHPLDEMWVQYIFIAVCSLSIILSIVLIEYLHSFYMKPMQQIDT